MSEFAEALVQEYFPFLSVCDASAAKFLHKDVSLEWMDKEKVTGKLKAVEAIKQIRPFTYVLSTVDCQETNGLPFSMIIITGMLRFGSEVGHRFHTSIYVSNEGENPLIMYQTMKLID